MKPRLLDILTELYPDVSRDELYARIMCGEVIVAGETIRDPKAQVRADAPIAFRRDTYVSRGGLKLEGALQAHRIDPRQKVVLDAGASTGGFTDCLLTKGAAYVHAVDVGWNQLHYSLRRRSDVGVHERCNIMDLTFLDPHPDFAVADLSFRSLRGAARHIVSLTSDRRLLALVKPQFEWRNTPDTFDGVVRSESDLRDILEVLSGELSTEGLGIYSITESVIRGRTGNREFFFLVGDDRQSVPIGSISDRLDELLPSTT